MDAPCDIAIIGAGAAGLMSAIWAGRTGAARSEPLRIVALDGASRIGAKILVAGGGRCNVTHFRVSERDYAGSTPGAIKKVLRRFDVPRTTEFFRELGVELKQEETGKLFPTTDDAHTVLDSLLAETRRLGVSLVHPWRVASITRGEDGFLIRGDSPPGFPSHEPILARRVILATGGKALPKTGSDGEGYAIAQSLGHSITPRVFPALVPLTITQQHFIRELSGLALPATVEVRSGTGKKLIAFTNSVLCTHFGLSGPGILDVSRHYLDSLALDPETSLRINWAPALTLDALDQLLTARRGISPARLLVAPPVGLPDRLARAICAYSGVDPSGTTEHLTRERRRALAVAVTEMTVPLSGHRGFTFAEATAGGVPLAELDLDTMESRLCPGLHLCGELCDVDGRIGGFNFQWAWASGHLAGTAADLKSASKA